MMPYYLLTLLVYMALSKIALKSQNSKTVTPQKSPLKSPLQKSRTTRWFAWAKSLKVKRFAQRNTDQWVFFRQYLTNLAIVLSHFYSFRAPHPSLVYSKATMYIHFFFIFLFSWQLLFPFNQMSTVPMFTCYRITHISIPTLQKKDTVMPRVTRFWVPGKKRVFQKPCIMKLVKTQKICVKYT